MSKKTRSRFRSEAPEVSIAIAGFNCEAYIADGVRSALAQKIDLEVLIIDDASTDKTLDIAQGLGAENCRVRILSLPRNMGPAAARNVALHHARGRWFAVLDADDLMHPDRLRMMIDTAEKDGADLIADDLIVFDGDGIFPPERFLKDRPPGAIEWISLENYLRSTTMFAKQPSLGYLKPVVRLETLRRLGIIYDERLRIGEDDKFVFQMLSAGMRYRLITLPGYYYRKHQSSISHRLSQRNIDQIAAITVEIGAALPTKDPELRSAFAARARSVFRAQAFTRFLDHAKAGAWRSAVRTLVGMPSILPMLSMPLTARIRRWMLRMAPSSGLKQRNILVVAGAARDGAIETIASLATHQDLESHLIIFGPRLSEESQFLEFGFRSVTLLPQVASGGIADPWEQASTRLKLFELGRKANDILLIEPVPPNLVDELRGVNLPGARYTDATKWIAEQRAIAVGAT